MELTSVYKNLILSIKTWIHKTQTWLHETQTWFNKTQTWSHQTHTWFHQTQTWFHETQTLFFWCKLDSTKRKLDSTKRKLDSTKRKLDPTTPNHRDSAKRKANFPTSMWVYLFVLSLWMIIIIFFVGTFISKSLFLFYPQQLKALFTWREGKPPRRVNR